MRSRLNWLMSSVLGFMLLVLMAMAQPAFAEEAKGLKPEDIAKLSEEAQKTLNGFAWTLEVSPSGVKKEDRKSTPDTLIFKDGKMSSEGLAKKGYGTSNYTLSIGDDGIPVFETMQRDENEGVAFWRGELVDGQIRGVISVQKAKEPAISFGFHGVKVGEASEIPAERVEPQPEIIPETVVPEPVAIAPEVPVAAELPTESAVADGVSDVEAETVAPAVQEAAVVEPVVETPAPEIVQPEPVKPPKKKRGFFG